MIDAPLDALVLSPHLDDAVFSCGGLLAQLAHGGLPVLVVTLHAGEPGGDLSPFARRLHREWGLDDGAVMAVRRGEDVAACAELGVEARHLPLPDALYRRGPDGALLYPSLAALFGPPHPADEAHLEALVAALAALPAAGRVLAPLAAGRHVDHVLVRRAAARCFGADLEHYEDYPYARRRLVRWKALGWPFAWRSRCVPLRASDLDAKCRSLRCYASQLGAAFADADDMERQVRAFARDRGGERLWRRRGRA